MRFKKQASNARGQACPAKHVAHTTGNLVDLGREKLTSPLNPDTAERGGSAQQTTDSVSRPSPLLKIMFTDLFVISCPKARGNLPRLTKPPVKFGERTWTEMTHPTAENAQ